jgi:hypothetical protein
VNNLFTVPLGTIHQRTLLTVGFSLRQNTTNTKSCKDDTYYSYCPAKKVSSLAGLEKIHDIFFITKTEF